MRLGRHTRAVPLTHQPPRRLDDAIARPRPHLTAAGTRITPKAGKTGVKPKPWQDRNWTFYDQIGAVHYSLNYKHNAITKVRFYVGAIRAEGDEPTRIDPEAEGDDAPTDAELAAVDEFARIEESVEGGAANLLADLAVNLDVAGEGYVWGHTDEPEGEIWTCLSTQELKVKDSAYTLITGEGDLPIDDDDVVIRIHRPHPRMWSDPDAPISSVAFECEEWLLLSRAMRSAATSRLSNGILLVPDEMSLMEDETADDVTPLDDSEQTEGDPFQAELIEAMLAPITREGTAADVVPLVWRGDAEALDKVRHLTFDRQMDKENAAKRDELLTRIAHGIDMPPEIVTASLAESNHWSAWLIDESTYKQHVDPTVLLMIEALTRSFLWPALQARGFVPDDYRHIRIWRDMSDLAHHPNRFSDALMAHERGAISTEALRRIGGFAEADAPDGDADVDTPVSDVDEPVGPSTVDQGPPDNEDSPADESVSDRIRQAMARIDLARRTRPEPDLTMHAQSGHVERFQTDGGGIRASGLGDIDVGLMARLQSATEAAAERALERAGNRLVTKVRNDKALKALIADVPARRVAAVLGPEQVERLQVRPEDLITEDTFDDLAASADEWLAGGQDAAAEEVARMAGQEFERDAEAEDESRDAAVGFFIGSLTASLLARLFTVDADPDPIEGGVPTGEGIDYRIDPIVIADTLSIAGGAPAPAAPSTGAAAGGVGSAGAAVTPSPSATPGTWAGGLGNGQRTLDYMIRVSLQPQGYVWRYGDPSARKVNFEPHRALDGLEFSSWTDERLAVTYEARWIGRSYFEPRDHRGCLCWVDRVVRRQPSPPGFTGLA